MRYVTPFKVEVNENIIKLNHNLIFTYVKYPDQANLVVRQDSSANASISALSLYTVCFDANLNA